MENNITVFGETNFRNERKRFGIKLDDRRRHIYTIGKTGMGKTELLANMTIQDIKAGHGLAVVDPHGEYVERMLDFIPKERLNDVVYFNPADLAHPIAFNVMEQVAPEFRHLVASGVMGVFKKIWVDVWSPRMEYILNNAILALLEVPETTLLGINRMFSDKDYRKSIVDQIKDPVVKSFWTQEYARYQQRYEVEATAAIQNKVGQFISASLVRNIIGQAHSTLDMRKVMDEGKILLINLSKGRIGEDNSRLLGALAVTKLQLAAMSRVDIPEAERKDFYLYVDEFQNFATESFANILSEARKYRLDLILAHQYIAQMDETVRDATFGNVGTLISFRVGAEDAEFLEKEFEPDFTAQDLVNLPKFNIYLKLMIDGVASRAFSSATLPPFEVPEKSFKDEIIKHSRETYGSTREKVEEMIASWSGVSLEELIVPADVSKGVRKEKRDSNKLRQKEEGRAREESPLVKSLKPQESYEVKCDRCGTVTRIYFKPDETRDIYCQKCLAEVRKEKQSKKDLKKTAEEGKARGELKVTELEENPKSLKELLGKATAQSQSQEKDDGASLSKPVKKEKKQPNLKELNSLLNEALKEAGHNKKTGGNIETKKISPNDKETLKEGEKVKFE
jgi:CxxC-x17-CxxC domain-containing protein